MNLLDIQKGGEILRGKLKQVELVIEKLKELNELSKKWEVENLDILVNNAFIGGASNSEAIARTVRDKTKNYLQKYLNTLRQIDFTESFIDIVSLKDCYEYYRFNDFFNFYYASIKNIHEFTSVTDYSKNTTQKFIETKIVIQKLIAQYESFTYAISQVDLIKDYLIKDNGEEYYEIRFLNENNTIKSLKENIYIIENIYKAIGSLMNNTQELTYSRIESGSLLLMLSGCAAIFEIMSPMLEKAYKVYTEQFSPSAKQNRMEKEIKMRGNYLKQLKDIMKTKRDYRLDISNEKKVLSVLGDLDTNIQKLYSNNPCIELNSKKLGKEEFKNSTFEVKFLESKEKDEELKKLIEINE